MGRKKAEERKSAGGRVIVEGFDSQSMEGAFSNALNKATGFFDAHHDIAVTVIGLVTMPKGGYHATLEVDITPMTYRLQSKMHSFEEEAALDRSLSYQKTRKQEEEHIKHLVHEHFLTTTGATPHVPDYFLINFKDADLLNHMIEKQFFHAGHKIEYGPEAPQATVKVLKPDLDDE